MACACGRCLEHAKTIGLPRRPSNRAVLRKAFRAEAKLWHPDRFENDPAKRLEAEEHFKLIQVAYRELWEHLESPVQAAREDAPAPPAPDPAPAPAPAAPRKEEPPIFFGGAPGCFTAPHLPREILHAVGEYLEGTECALAFVDLSQHARGSSVPNEFLLLTNYRVIVRNHLRVVALLWYTDLGEIRLVDQIEEGRQSLWQRIVEAFSGVQQRYALEIDRHTGAPFCSITDGADDSVKKVVYNFLLQKKHQTSS